MFQHLFENLSLEITITRKSKDLKFHSIGKASINHEIKSIKNKTSLVSELTELVIIQLVQQLQILDNFFSCICDMKLNRVLDLLYLCKAPVKTKKNLQASVPLMIFFLYGYAYMCPERRSGEGRQGKHRRPKCHFEDLVRLCGTCVLPSDICWQNLSIAMLARNFSEIPPPELRGLFRHLWVLDGSVNQGTCG